MATYEVSTDYDDFKIEANRIERYDQYFVTFVDSRGDILFQVKTEAVRTIRKTDS